MSANVRRYVLAGLAVAVLVSLLVWQQQREARIRECLQSGGDWIGEQSLCRYPPGRILIRPDLKRV